MDKPKSSLKRAEKDRQTIYQIKVVLLETNPPIWRQLLVPSTITLHRAHLILQAAMGWANYHLYKFQIGNLEYAMPDPDNEFYELDFKNSKRTKLWQVLMKKGGILHYEYDFGDGWEHMLFVEDIIEREDGKQYPICLGGERACPPEDCGGTHGYAELLEIIRNHRHKEYKDMMTWLGGRFNPKAFDIEIANLKLAAMRLK
ncbi:MAG: plasmid pRiA4b ORF-3 family protein [Calditrichota bacterium]